MQVVELEVLLFLHDRQHGLRLLLAKTPALLPYTLESGHYQDAYGIVQTLSREAVEISLFRSFHFDTM